MKNLKNKKNCKEQVDRIRKERLQYLKKTNEA
jgi:hypothetical protein